MFDKFRQMKKAKAAIAYAKSRNFDPKMMRYDIGVELALKVEEVGKLIKAKKLENTQEVKDYIVAINAYYDIVTNPKSKKETILKGMRNLNRRFGDLDKKIMELMKDA